MAELSIDELKDPAGGLAHQVVALYEASFPIEERDPSEDLLAVMALAAAHAEPPDRRWHCLVAAAGDRLAGFATCAYFTATRVGLLAFLATQPETRGQGLGGRLLAESAAWLAVDAAVLGGPPPLGLCWEVERPADAASEADAALRRRRIGFYRRHGALLLDQVDYLTPPVAPGQPEMQYHLMFLPAPGQPAALDGPDGAAPLRAIIDTALLYGYDLDRDSKYYRRALRSIGL